MGHECTSDCDSPNIIGIVLGVLFIIFLVIIIAVWLACRGCPEKVGKDGVIFLVSLIVIALLVVALLIFLVGSMACYIA